MRRAHSLSHLPLEGRAALKGKGLVRRRVRSPWLGKRAGPAGPQTRVRCVACVTVACRRKRLSRRLAKRKTRRGKAYGRRVSGRLVVSPVARRDSRFDSLSPHSPQPTQDRQRRKRSLIPCVTAWVCGSGSRAPAPAVPGARPRGCDDRIQLGMWTMPTGHSTRSPGAVGRGPTAVRSACTLRAPELGSLRPPAVPLRFRCVHRHSAHTRIGPLSIRLPSPVWTRR